MPLILAIEPDRLQANHLSSMVRGRLRAELVLADAADTALAQLGDRVPDLVLTSALLSTKDETALADWLRTLDGTAAHVQTLTIPVLEAPAPRQSTSRTGIFSLALLNDRVSSPAAPDGCDPAVFAEQCAAYLDRATKDRAHDDEVAVVEPPMAIEKPNVATPPVEDERPHTIAAAPPTVAQPIVDEKPPLVLSLSSLHVGRDDPERVEGSKDERVAVEAAAREIVEAPPPPQSTGAASESVEIDLTAMLDDSVFQQLSEAIETVSRDSSHATPSSNGGEVWTPSSLGSEAVWPAMDFSASPRPNQPSKTAPARSQPNRFPSRKPIQDEWGFFDPAQCGFSALLAKLDEITRVASPLPEPTPPAGHHDVSH